MIYEVGAEKALARTFAYITNVSQRIPCVSILHKQNQMITYKFKHSASSSKKT